MIPTADSLSGFKPHQDSLSCERRLAATIISKAWKGALIGDKGAFDFALSNDSLFAFWCQVCGLDLESAKSCFKRLKAGELPDTFLPLIFSNLFHHKLTISHLSSVLC